MSYGAAQARFAARKANLQGDSDADFATSEMLLEVYADLMTALEKCKGNEAAFVAFFAETAPWMFGSLAKMLKGEFFGSKLTAGDLAIGVIFEFCLALQANCLDAFPSLKAFYERIHALPAFSCQNDLPYYLKRE